MEDMIPFNGLRGVCAMAIFLGHQTDMFLTSPSQWWRGGRGTAGQTFSIGIEYLQAMSLFFLLSGIPLARLYSTTDKVRTREGSFDFWRKRFARLAPMYYLTLGLNVLAILLACENVDTSALLSSFLGCALLLQSWFVSLINVGGVLWQIAVFALSYALFPFLSRRISGRGGWSVGRLTMGIVGVWLFSAGLWFAVFPLFPPPEREGWWWIWHVHCVSRLPHAIAGVLLGELVERKRLEGGPTTTDETRDYGDGCDPGIRYDASNANLNADRWAIATDFMSLILLATAVQAPIVQAYRGSDVRVDVSIGLQALLLPLHAAWLSGMVLAFQHGPSTVSNGGDVGCYGGGGGAGRPLSGRVCWTRRFLSLRPILTLGDLSLAIYCLHLPVLFAYTSALAFVRTGDRRIFPTVDDYDLRVRASLVHAPIQWVLVVAVSYAVSRWIEAPLRKVLAGKRSRGAVALSGAMNAEATTLVLAGGVASYDATSMK